MIETNQDTLKELFEFINDSPTAWHAVEKLEKLFVDHHFQKLENGDAWSLAKGNRYFISLGSSSFAAFILPKGTPTSACILGTHTDSPALKLKPNSEYVENNMVMLGVELYGSPLISSWLNRDLGLAGKVYYRTNNQVHSKSVNLTSNPLTIPQLAIHLDRGVNETGLLLNKETHLAALAGLQTKKMPAGSFLDALLRQQITFDEIISHDLFLYPLEPLAYIGENQQMISGYRLDNLCSVHAAAKGLAETTQISENRIKMAVFWDSEEVGSCTAHGAASPLLPHLLERILISLGSSREDYLRLLTLSQCVSIDLAHALHPNYPEKHERHHQSILNQGLVLKFNAQQRYATSASSAAKIIELCQHLNLRVQKFVMRNDMPCGSTIGPLTATLTGLETVDIGIPQLSMHSSREIVSSQDHLDMCRLLKEI